MPISLKEIRKETRKAWGTVPKQRENKSGQRETESHFFFGAGGFPSLIQMDGSSFLKNRFFGLKREARRKPIIFFGGTARPFVRNPFSWGGFKREARRTPSAGRVQFPRSRFQLQDIEEASVRRILQKHSQAPGWVGGSLQPQLPSGAPFFFVLFGRVPIF